jgi:putative flippase GtrA
LHAHAEHAESPNRAAVSATVHCLTGCGIGEVAGMAITTAAGWGNAASIVVSVVLAFVFGYALTFQPVLRAGVGWRRAAGIAFASDTVSIVIMEAVDNAFVAVVPGALAAGLGDAKFWWSILVGFAIAFGPAFLANRWLIARGRGHAVAHAYH